MVSVFLAISLAAFPPICMGQSTAPATAAQTASAVPVSDEEFFAALDPANPALARVRALIARKDYAAAARALGDHFRARKVRAGFWPPDLRSVQNPDDLVLHGFSFYGSARFDAGNPIRWNEVFLNDRELTYALNRHQHLVTLAGAYRRSRDARYAKAFVEQVRDWIAQNPAPSALRWAAWRNLEVATRLGVWSDVFFQFLAAPEFTPDDQMLMLKSLYHQAQWLAPQAKAGGGSWAISLATGLAAVSVLFPELKPSREWQEAAYATLVDELGKQVYADGSHHALSPHSHNASLTAFWLPFKLAVENGVAVPATYRETLERMCAYQAYIRRPSGQYPAFNASDPTDCRMLLEAAARFFSRPDFAYILTAGEQGTTPTSTSCAFRPSGVFIMRDGWDKEANYMAIDAGPFGTSLQHEDKLGFELAAYGSTILVDPGYYSLDSADPYTNYLATTEAHNTATVDGAGQQRGQLPRSWRPDGNSANCWVGAALFDYLAGGYVEGYRPAPGVRHFRRIFFVKDKRRPYWLISDRVTGTGKHRVSARFQFVPGTLRRHEPPAFTTALARGNLALCAAVDAATSWTASVLTGSQKPWGGWVSFVYSKVQPAPQLVFDIEATLPATVHYVLTPFLGEAMPPAVRIKDNGGGLGASDVTSLEIDFGHIRDAVFIDHTLQRAKRNIAGCPTQECFVVVRTVRGGAPAVLIDGDAGGQQPPADSAAVAAPAR